MEAALEMDGKNEMLIRMWKKTVVA